MTENQKQLCIQACEECATACMQDTMLGTSACEKLRMDCADICRATVTVLLRDSALVLRFCTFCCEVCRACAAACVEHADECPYCRRCQQICGNTSIVLRECVHNEE